MFHVQNISKYQSHDPYGIPFFLVASLMVILLLFTTISLIFFKSSSVTFIKLWLPHSMIAKDLFEHFEYFAELNFVFNKKFLTNSTFSHT